MQYVCIGRRTRNKINIEADRRDERRGRERQEFQNISGRVKGLRSSQPSTPGASSRSTSPTTLDMDLIVNVTPTSSPKANGKLEVKLARKPAEAPAAAAGPE